MTGSEEQLREKVRRRISEEHLDISEGWTFGRFATRHTWLQRLMISQMVKSFGTYQPVKLAGREIKTGDRECAGRWTMIEEAI
jgi:hypothetical protein